MPPVFTFNHSSIRGSGLSIQGNVRAVQPSLIDESGVAYLRTPLNALPTRN